jgi:antitoxin (DNA-binding transcriptional repressor) of toxin-antitoxin stability system
VESAINGEETIIAKSGKPVAKLIPISPQKPRRRLGILKGKIKIANDFDAPLSDDILDSFEGHL